MRQLTREQIGILSAAGAAVLFGMAFPATAIALRAFTPVATAAVSCTMALVVVLILAAIGVLPKPRVPERTAANLARLAFIAAVGGLIFIVAANIATALSGPTIAAFVSSLYAVLATLFAVPLLGERIRPSVVASLVLSLVGTALLAGFSPIGGSAAGIGFGVVAAISFGLYLVLARKWGPAHGLRGTIVLIALLLGRGPVLLAVELVREPGSIIPSNPPPEALWAMAYLVVGPLLVAQVLVLASVARVPARRTSASLLLTPISGAIGSAILLGDVLTVPELIGGALLLLGIAGASGLLDGPMARSLTLFRASPYNPDEITRD